MLGASNWWVCPNSGCALSSGCDQIVGVPFVSMCPHSGCVPIVGVLFVVGVSS